MELDGPPGAYAEVGRVWVLATRHEVCLRKESLDLGKAVLSSCCQLPDEDTALNFQTANTPGNQGQNASILKWDSGVRVAAVIPTACPVPIYPLSMGTRAASLSLP